MSKNLTCIILAIVTMLILPAFLSANDGKPKDSVVWTTSTPPTSLEESSITTKGNTCTYGGSTYSKGDQICINNLVHQCGSNGWFMIKKSCK